MKEPELVKDDRDYITTSTTQQSTHSKFKIGDWVIYIGKGYHDGEILQITNIDEKDFYCKNWESKWKH